MSKLLSVEKALALILGGVEPLTSETVPLAQADGRVLAEDLAAKRTQPPFPASAMDGYAVRASDLSNVPTVLRLVGESAAGHGYSGSVGEGECVRIFTGAPLPDGADSIAIQENAEADGENITFAEPVETGRYVRPAGLDFSEAETMLKAGQVLDPASVSLAAAMNHPALPVRKRPLVSIIASGDELVLPGAEPEADQIVASNSFGVAAIVARAGAIALDQGTARDTLDSLAEKFEASGESHIVVTLGGVSVGDHDLVREALEARGVELSFWKLAMRPGKPVMFGLGKSAGRKTRYLGLPGNPVSSLICTYVFVVPLIRGLLGLPTHSPRQKAKLAIDLPQNDEREEYLRATLEKRNDDWYVTPFQTQDSSMLKLYAKADCLLIRPALAPAAQEGGECEIIMLREAWLRNTLRTC